MDSRGPHPPHHHQHHHHQHHQPHHQLHHQPPPGLMMYNIPPTSNIPNSSNPQLITPIQQQQQQQQQQQHNRFPFNTTPTPSTTPPPSAPTYSPDDSSSGLRPSGFGIDQLKKKRGRPRKYSPDGGGSNIALGLSPTPISTPIGGTGGGDGGGLGHGDSGGGATPSSDINGSKKNRGRPASSSKVQLDALGNCGVGFTPHVILVNAGEDIASKIVAFSKDGPRTVCVLSANGSICNVSLRQPSMSGSVVNYEGRFQIISLSGSFLFSENNGGEVRSGGLSVSLAGSDGRVLGGGVAGMLVAATPVQIIVGSFIADGKKPKYMPSVPQSQMLNYSALPLPAPGGNGSPASEEEEESSEGSEGNNGNIERNMNVNMNMNMGGSYGNSNHNMQMYNHQMGGGWPNSSSSSKMLQN